MSDKSFGDHINKNIVKNPLLSSAVTGLSLEDLTHKAVLLPATPTQGQVTRLDQQDGSQYRTLAKAEDDKSGFTYGDAFSNVPIPNTPTNSLPNVLDSQNYDRNRVTDSGKVSKASVKSEDDFDVNEYIARLHGTRYVSAPLHSHMKEDQNANLEAEESLEEINLNESGVSEPVGVQQSLTADIAQNFSQLPTVLPHVASAVFSSFSNMLSMNKSRDQTPDEVKTSEYQEVQFERSEVGVPLMGVEESAPKDVGLPPKEPPMSSVSSYRITSKKKYAQIPGLSSGGANVTYIAQNMPYSAQNPAYNAPIQQIIPPFFTPVEDSTSSNLQKPTEIRGDDNSSISQSSSFFVQADDKNESKANVTSWTELNTQPVLDSYNMFNPERSIYKVSEVQRACEIGNTEVKDTTSVVFDIKKEDDKHSYENRPFFPHAEGQPNLFTATENKQEISHSIKPGPPIIPPPPMFSNIPRRDSQTSVGKSVLPPSVARRIAANQPIIKTQAIPTSPFPENIFVPSVVPETTDQMSVPQQILPPISSNIPPRIDQTVIPTNTQPLQGNVLESVAMSVQENATSCYLQPQLDYSTGSFFTSPKQEVTQSAFDIAEIPNIPPPYTSVSASSMKPPSVPYASQFQLNTSASVPAVTTPSSVTATGLPSVAPPPSFVPMFASTSQNMPLPSNFFNPSQVQPTQDLPHPITQYPPDVNLEPAKPLVEPPKATGNLNFRMTKKRPQYYSGPIDGVGDISNNVKPTIQPVMPPVPSAGATNEAALFTPKQQPQMAPSNDEASVPFDISRPVDHTALHAPFESKPQPLHTHFDNYQTEPHVQEYNTAFDLSRPNTESFDTPKQEYKGFGIIGSLKSKLSTIDINKIQSTVTTFFDPAYKESKVEPAQEALPYTPPQHEQYSQEQLNFEITVPDAEESQYRQFGYQNIECINYNPSDQYYQSHNAYIYAPNEAQKASSYFSDTNIMPKSYADQSLNKNTQASALTNYTQDNIPHNVENVSSTKEGIEKVITFYNPATIPDLNAPKTETNTNSSRQSYETSEECAYAYDSMHVPKASFTPHGAIGEVPVKASIIPQTDLEQAFKHFDGSLGKSSTFFENPIIASSECQIKAIDDATLKSPKDLLAKSQGKIPFVSPLAPAVSFFDNPIVNADDSSDEKDDLAANMKKLALAEEIAIANSPFQAVDFAIGVIAQPKAIEMSAALPKLIGERAVSTIVPKNIIEINTVKECKLPQDMKTISLMETLSKPDIPILGVSSIPLFGLSAIIADKSKEIAYQEKDHKCVTIDAPKDISRPRLEKQASISHFDDVTPDNKLHEEVVKTAVTHLSITDVKNVLLIEPPQENLGTILKRNASSTLLKDLSETDTKNGQNLSEDRDSSWNLDAAIVTSKHNVSICYDRKGSGFFDHSIPLENLCEDIICSENTENVEKESDFNICETCREVNVPEDKETDNVTTQLIENINSSIQLTNPIEATLTEDPDAASDETFDYNQLTEDISQITQNTLDTLQAQSATDLLDDGTKSGNEYDWTTEQLAYASITAIDKDFGINFGATGPSDYGFNVDDKLVTADAEYTFKIDPNAIGFFGDNSLFFDNVPKNASDEIKAEFKTSHDDIVNLPKQMSLPSAPPAEDDTKSDETGCLDVNSIEQDAKKDFPLEEEFIIEPSETDDDKIEFRERKKSSEDFATDTFTDRIEKFKNKVDADSSENVFELKTTEISDGPPKSMASYFDTGNYAVETHYRNSLTSLANMFAFHQGSSIRIPPGFEDEFRRRFSGASVGSSETKEPCIPETSTQTRTTLTPTYTSAQDVPNVTDIIASNDSEEPEEVSHESTLAQAFKPINKSIEDQTQIFGAQIRTSPKAFEQETIQQNVTLPDPSNFFSSPTEEPKPATEEAPESFSRLASYFSMPPAQPDHSKSFFELSQSQNHYRHVNTETQKSQQQADQNINTIQRHHFDHQTQANLQNLMQDLTSTQNVKFDDSIVRTVNHFSVKYDNVSSINLENIKLNTNNNVNLNSVDSSSGENNKFLDSPIDLRVDKTDEDINIANECEYCNENILNVKDFKVRTAVNDSDTAKRTESNMNDKECSDKKKSVSVDLGSYGVDEDSHDGNAVLHENRSCTEYTPVRHHWFYRVDVDDKSLWRGFSVADSNALERAYLSPDVKEDTLVPTDGGRYDVNVVGRLRVAVYWKEKPTNVRRCSWFYKGNTDARYVPYTEAVADKLEEEYRHGVTTGEWHRRLVLPNSELVVMHGPAVMVHFLHSGCADSFSSPPPSTSRPRVVRRGHEESEIEDSEPSSIDHLLLLCHGMGSACDMRFRSVEEVVEDFRTTSLQLVQSHYRDSYDNGIVSRVEVLPISWHAQLHVGEDGVDKRMNRLTLDSIPRLRAFTNHTVLDALFYTSPVYHQTIIDTVCYELNRIYSLFKRRNPNFKGEVSLGGHSLGSVILYDLLCHQNPEEVSTRKSSADKTYLPGTDEKVKALKYPQLQFPPAALYALGSPIAIFECVRGVESLGLNFALPTCKNFFNIFHPYDPIAYRIEPLINPLLQDRKPFLIPHHKGRKRMHLELKDTMVRVGADLKQKLIESLRTTWNKWKSSPPPDGQLEKVVEEEMEKERLCDETKEDEVTDEMTTPEMLGKLNCGRRVDYVLQEAPLEMINEYLFAMSSHVGYWESEDTMLLMLREIYSSLGVQPDTTLPQQSMTVQRTTIQKQDEATIVNENEYPSTSRGGT